RSCLANGQRLRVTLDEDLRFFAAAPLGALRPDPARPLALGPALVLEVKYDGELPPWLAAALEGLEEARDFSKFRLGMLAVQLAAESDVHGSMKMGDTNDNELAQSQTSVG